jgi:hypothetical protein
MHDWLLEPELLTARTPEPLMGWVSANDTFSELRGRMRFQSQDEAIAFAKRHGWDYVVEEPTERRIISALPARKMKKDKVPFK